MRRVSRSLRALGVYDQVDVLQGNEDRARNIAENICGGLTTQEDLLAVELPYKIPASRLYDSILKMQRGAEVDLEDPRVFSFVEKFVRAALNINDVVTRYDITAVVSSHTIAQYCAALAWISLDRGIPCYVMDNYNGSLRVSRVRNSREYFTPNDCPDPIWRSSLTGPVREALIERGYSEIVSRFMGKGVDLGGRLAHASENVRVDSSELRRRYGWAESDAVVCIMMCNWFDYPHALGMQHFANVADWLRETMETVSGNRSIRYLIKPHPAEYRWYGGPKIADAIRKPLGGNFAILGDGVHTQSILDAADAIITPYGTAGIEYACHGKPVLLADRSFYSEWGFADTPKSRADYVTRLKTFDGRSNPLPEEKRRDACLYAGMYMAPAADSAMTYPCDSGSYEVYRVLPRFIARNRKGFIEEQVQIKRWLETDYRSYHAYRCALAAGWKEPSAS